MGECSFSSASPHVAGTVPRAEPVRPVNGDLTSISIAIDRVESFSEEMTRNYRESLEVALRGAGYTVVAPNEHPDVVTVMALGANGGMELRLRATHQDVSVVEVINNGRYYWDCMGTACLRAVSQRIANGLVNNMAYSTWMLTYAKLLRLAGHS